MCFKIFNNLFKNHFQLSLSLRDNINVNAKATYWIERLLLREDRVLNAGITRLIC